LPVFLGATTLTKLATHLVRVVILDMVAASAPDGLGK
jgi:hypothetical protein